MSSSKINYLINVGMAMAFILSFITGILKWPNLIVWLGFSYLQFPMRALTLIHDWSGLALGLLVLVHLVLHWKWIVLMIKKLLKKKSPD